MCRSCKPEPEEVSQGEHFSPLGAGPNWARRAGALAGVSVSRTSVFEQKSYYKNCYPLSRPIPLGKHISDYMSLSDMIMSLCSPYPKFHHENMPSLISPSDPNRAQLLST